MLAQQPVLLLAKNLCVEALNSAAGDWQIAGGQLNVLQVSCRLGLGWPSALLPSCAQWSAPPPLQQVGSPVLLPLSYGTACDCHRLFLSAVLTVKAVLQRQTSSNVGGLQGFSDSWQQ